MTRVETIYNKYNGKTIAFCTYVSDEFYHSFGTDKLVASAKYFYPEIPFFVYGTQEINKIELPIESLHPFIINKLIAQYEIVVYFDADSIITGNIDEVFEELENCDVVCVRNNNDYGKAGSGDPISQQNRDINIYVNAGFVATNNKEFVAEWMHENRRFAELAPFGSQSVLNTIIDRYNWVLIDAIDRDCYYGVSVLSGQTSHWESWMKISVIDGELIFKSIVNGGFKAGTVKVLHHAGGFKPDKLGLYMFSDEVRKRLIEIIYPV